MDILDLVYQIFQICVIPLLGILTKFLVDFLGQKKEQMKEAMENDLASKYLEMLYTTIASCVIATNQTYVNTLKKEGKFDKAAQQKAFEMTRDAVLDILSEDAKEYLTNIFGDLNKYLEQLIESEVSNNKQQ